MILARLLLPVDYGVFGMAAAVHGVLYLLRDLGAGHAVMQPGLTPTRFLALCRLALLGGVVTGALCLASAPLAARFFNTAELAPVLAVLAFTFPCTGLAAPRLALLYREQQARTAATIDVVALAAGSGAGLLAAWGGAGVWSLVVLTLCQEAVTCVLALAWCPRSARPPRPERAEWRSLALASTNLSLTQLANYALRTCDQIVVGRVGGADALGVYSRGVQATTLPVQFTVAPFTTWITAALARARDDVAAFRATFRRALNGLAHLTLPAAAICLAQPELVIRVLFGDRWLAAAPIVRWLSLALAVQPWVFAPGWLLVALGRTRRLAATAMASLLIVGTAVILLRDAGAEAVAAAAAVASAAAAVLGLLLAAVGTPIGSPDLLQASWRPLLANAGLAGCLLAADRLVVGSLLATASIVTAVGLGYATVVLIAWPQLRAEWRDHPLWRR